MSDQNSIIRAKFLEDEDYYVTGWEKNPKKPRLNFLILISFGLATALFVPDMLKSRAQGETKWWLPLAVVVPLMVGLWWWFGPVGARLRIRRAAKKIINNPPTESWLEFSAEGFMAPGRSGRSSFYPWASVPHAAQLRDGLIVFFEDYEFAYYWIPQSAFFSPTDYESVLTTASSKVKKFTPLTP